jgi:hypothetical protein
MPRREAAGWPGQCLWRSGCGLRRGRGSGAAVSVGQSPAADVGGKQVIRRPSWSTGRSCAPGCGTSRRAMTRVRAGHPVRFSSPVIGHVGAVARFAVAVVGRGPRRLGEPVQGVGASCQVFCVRPCCWVRGRVRGRGWPSTDSAAAESPQLAQRLRAISTTTGTASTYCGVQWSTPTVTLIRGRLPRLAA